jgi:diguanylate cyclase (GGDEF)-like protein
MLEQQYSLNGEGDSTGRPLIGIRVKVLSLLACSALLPALLVGVASYLTARNILVDKVSSELSAQAESSADLVEVWLQERSNEAEVFASSFIVSENIDRWSAAVRRRERQGALEASTRIQEYLDEVRDRSLYEGLAVVDSRGERLASSGRVEGGDSSELLGESSKGLELRNVGGAFLILSKSPVKGRTNELLGTLTTISSLEDLWIRLSPIHQSESSALRLVDATGQPVLDSRSDPPELARDLETEGVENCLAGHNGISEYRDGRGDDVLGAYRYLSSVGVGVLVEMDSAEAFAAVQRLRNLSILIVIVVAGLVTGLGYVLVVGLAKPIEALTEGAKAVSQGDLSFEIPVSSRDEIGYLTRVFNQMTSALKETHASLEQLSTTDELTKLFNRRHLARVFASELDRMERSETLLSLMILDIDHFKDFNDRHGHLQGDAFLREVGKFLKGRIRSTDVAARYGGEEFVVLLPGIGKEHAKQKAEWLRKDFESAQFLDQESAAVTISIGVATCPEDGSSQEELLKKADGALYEAKRQGRNRVSVA